MGVTGEHVHDLQLPTSLPGCFRNRGSSKSPAARRRKVRAVFYLYPKYRPTVDTLPDGPANFHADFSLVTANSPAREGEVLAIAARSLGLTWPDLLRAGTRSVKSEPLEEVNSPVEVTVNAKDAEVFNKIGWPGTTDLYRMDFRVPEGLAPGTATVQVCGSSRSGPTRGFATCSGLCDFPGYARESISLAGYLSTGSQLRSSMSAVFVQLGPNSTHSSFRRDFATGILTAGGR